MGSRYGGNASTVVKITKHYKLGHILNDIDFLPFSDPMFFDGANIFSSIDASKFLAIVNKIKESDYRKGKRVIKLIELSKSVNNSNNPLIIKYSTKNEISCFSPVPVCSPLDPPNSLFIPVPD